MLPSQTSTGDTKGCRRSPTTVLDRSVDDSSAHEICLPQGRRAGVTHSLPPSTPACQRGSMTKATSIPQRSGPTVLHGKTGRANPQLTTCNAKYIRGCFSILLFYYIYFSNFASPHLFPQQTNSGVEQAWIILIPFYFISLWHFSVCFGEEGVVGACVLLCNYKLAF